MPQVPAHVPRFARFRRRLFNLLAVLSVALWLVLVLLWVDTRLLGNVRTLYERQISPSGKNREVVAIQCWMDGFKLGLGEPLLSSSVPFLARLFTKYDRWSIPGASLVRMSGNNEGRWWGSRGFEVQISHWLAIVAGGLPAVVAIVYLKTAWRRRRRTMAGLCLHCGYDLRASKDRCPECGAAIPAKAVKEVQPTEATAC